MRRPKLIGTMAILLGGLLATGLVAGQTGGIAISSLARRTETVANAVGVSQQLLVLLGTGVTLGLGLGAIVGSVSVYKYWDRKLSSDYQ